MTRRRQFSRWLLLTSFLGWTPAPNAGALGPDKDVESLRRYYECRAFIQRKPELCRGLAPYQDWALDVSGGGRKPLSEQDDYQTHCANIYKHFTILQLNITKRPDAMSICETPSFIPEERDNFGTREECEWMTSPQPEAGCRKPLDASLGVSAIQDCLAYGVYHADCSLIREAPLITEETRAAFQAKCRDAAAYHRAYQGKSAALCGDSLVCRMLMGEKACGRYLEELSGLPANLKAVDALLAQAQALDDPPYSAEHEKHKRQCLAEFAEERVLAAPMHFPLDDALANDLRQYHECEAFSRREADVCGRLSRYPSSRQKDLEPRCRTSYIRLNIIELNVTRRPEAAEACQALPFSQDDLYETTVEKECLWMTTPAVQPQCRDPISPSLETFRVKDCLAHHVYHADESRCSLIEKAPLPKPVRAVYRTRCREAAAYRKAYQSKNADLCGDSLVCRMLLGERVCTRYLDDFRSRFCSIWAQKSLMRGILIRANALLERYEPKSDPSYAPRREAFEALLRKFDQSFSP